MKFNPVTKLFFFWEVPRSGIPSKGAPSSAFLTKWMTKPFSFTKRWHERAANEIETFEGSKYSGPKDGKYPYNISPTLSTHVCTVN